ncbi:MAG: hypothetical protein JXR97_06500 [Planctomycetes bacterium]|nr:hypothetical protein [Planctomycetota bacterium]
MSVISFLVTIVLVIGRAACVELLKVLVAASVIYMCMLGIVAVLILIAGICLVLSR